MRCFLAGSIVHDEDIEDFLQRFLIYILRHEHVIKHLTEEQCADVFVWSAYTLFDVNRSSRYLSV
jgi:hypothetical protein